MTYNTAALSSITLSKITAVLNDVQYRSPQQIDSLLNDLDAFSRMTFRKMTFSRMTFSRMIFSRTIFSKMIFSIVAFDMVTVNRTDEL